MDFKYLDEMKEKLDKKRPLPQEIVEKLRKQLIENLIFHSTTISGHTKISLNETKVILKGITLSNITLEEQCKVINHKEALEFIEELVKNKEDITERIIKQIHFIVLKDSNRYNAGKYRNVNVEISGAKHVPP